MNHCGRVRKNLVAFLSGELEEGARQRVEQHLRSCPACRQELDSLRQVIHRSEEWQEVSAGVLASIDWEKTSERIVDSIWSSEASPQARAREKKFRLFSPQLRPVLAGLLAGVLLGVAASWIVFRGRLLEKKSGSVFFASGEFLDRVDLEIARRETLDYLEKSQLILLDLVQMKTEDGRARLSEGTLERARELLSKKKFLNPQLKKVEIAKAKEICDQIELLFTELASLSEGLSESERQELQDMIEKSSLLLKIRLLKKELHRSEV